MQLLQQVSSSPRAARRRCATAADLAQACQAQCYMMQELATALVCNVKGGVLGLADKSDTQKCGGTSLHGLVMCSQRCAFHAPDCPTMCDLGLPAVSGKSCACLGIAVSSALRLHCNSWPALQHPSALCLHCSGWPALQHPSALCLHCRTRPADYPAGRLPCACVAMPIKDDDDPMGCSSCGCPILWP